MRDRLCPLAVSFHPDPDWNVPYVPPPIVQYIAFQAADVFHATHGRYPGVGLRDADGREREVDCGADGGVLESIAAKWLAGRGWAPDADTLMADDESSSTLPKSVRDALGEMHVRFLFPSALPLPDLTELSSRSPPAASAPAGRTSRRRPPSSAASSPRRPLSCSRSNTSRLTTRPSST